MSVVVMAYHEMGHACLHALLAEGVSVAAVFTYEDDPAECAWFGSVAALARQHGVPVHSTEHVNDPTWVERIRALAPDVIFSFYYRHVLGPALLAIPRHGAVNIHGSLLPRYRGRCPVNWQLVHGERQSGVTLHYMVARPDAGDIIGQAAVDVGPDDTALELYTALVRRGERLLAEHLAGILAGTAPRRSQDSSRATVFGGRRPEDGRIDWHRPAREIHDLVRAVAPPWPGAFGPYAAGTLRVHRTRVVDDLSQDALRPGEFRCRGHRLFAGTGDGVLELVDCRLETDRATLASGDDR